jgi:aryl-alcohol dehydrogenase-like predicted oxidoreductase
MQYRLLGRTGMSVSSVSFGAWAIGGSWGAVDDEESMRTLHAALDSGVNFIDTADVYGDGRSERLLARLRAERPGERFYVATKAGRRLPVQTREGYSRANLDDWVGRSLLNLDVDAIDLLQLHCPPSAVFGDTGVYQILDDFVRAGKIHHYGVSVERIDEALEAIRHPGVETVQIIFNIFRPRPAEVFFPEALRRKVGVLARVPLASGLLTGKLTATSTFADDDHRQFNRNGEAFDKGETFSGVPYDVGLHAVEELRPLVPAGSTLPQLALRWTLMFDAISCTIPGARTPDQARSNAAAAEASPLDTATMAAIARVYDKHVREHVHQLW